MMLDRRSFVTAGLGAFGAVALSACGSGNTDSDSGSDKKEAKGQVYYLNFKPEQDEQWQELAKVYTDETGVPVTVKTAASGQYETSLKAEMAKSQAPTLFQVNGPVGLASWKDYCYDLDGAEILKGLTNDAFELKGDDGKIKAVAYVVETYGLIYNKDLLKKAGHDASEISDFDSLKKVVEDITKRKDELGFAAFTSAGMDSSDDWRFKTHLANLPIYYEYKDEGSPAPTLSRAPTCPSTATSGTSTSTTPPASLASSPRRLPTTRTPSSSLSRRSSIRTAPGTTRTSLTWAATSSACSRFTSEPRARRTRACVPAPRTTGA